VVHVAALFWRKRLGDVVALEVFVKGVEAGVGEQMAEGFVVAVAGGEMGAVETAKLKDGGAGTRLVVGVSFGFGRAGREFGFVFVERSIGGVRHRGGTFLQAVRKDAAQAAEFVWFRDDL
jgi:hypothetical protein